MSTSKIKVAFIDVDRTIFSVNSGNILVWKAFTGKLMGINQLLKAFWYAVLYRLRIGNASDIIDKMALWTEGVKAEEFEKLCQKIFETYLKKKIRPEIINEVKILIEDGIKPVILSAALSAICKPTALILDIQEVICSELAVINGKYTGFPQGKINYAEEKLSRVIDYCKQNKINLNDASCYSDSFSDIPVLQSVGLAFCISPDKRLRNKAKKMNWKILDW